MQNKYLKYLLIALLVVFVVPQIALAAWWNPFSWGFWNSIFHKQTPITQQTKLSNNLDLNTYLPGKVIFTNFASGEWGTFNADHTITLNWGLSYAGQINTARIVELATGVLIKTFLKSQSWWFSCGKL